MRSGSTLSAEQKKEGYVPQIRVVLTKAGEDTLTYTPYTVDPSLYQMTHTEQPHNQQAVIHLYNVAGGKTDIDYEGYTATIGYGFTLSGTPTYSDCAPLTLTSPKLVNIRGKLSVKLVGIGIPNLLDKDKASTDYTTVGAQTVKELFDEVATDLTGAGAVYDHCTSYNVEWDSEDDLVDSFVPGAAFRISKGESRLKVLIKLLNYTKCVMRFEADGKIHVFVPIVSGPDWAASTAYTANDYVQPTTPNNNFTYQCTSAGTSDSSEPTWPTTAGGTVVDNGATWTAVAPQYEYTHSTGGHKFLAKTYTRRTVFPAKIQVDSRSGESPAYTGSYTDPNTSSNLVKTEFITATLASNAQAAKIAEARVQHLQLDAERGSGTVPLNVLQEVYDYVKMTDAVEGDNRLGNCGMLVRYFAAKKLTMEFRYGGINLGVPVDSDEGGQGTIDYYPHIQYLYDNMGLLLDEVLEIKSHGLVLDETWTYGTGYDPNDKRRVFTAEPTAPYSVGDLWLQVNMPFKKCITARDTGAYSAGEWVTIDLDEIANGTTYARVKSTSLDIDGLVVMDAVVNGTYSKILTTNINAGNIVLTTSTSYSSGGTAWDLDQVPEGTTYKLFTPAERTAIADVAADNKVTSGEKLTIYPVWIAVVAEKTDIDTEADTFSVSKTAYGTAYTNLDTYLNSTLDSPNGVFNGHPDTMTTTVVTRSAWDGFWNAYMNAKIEILNAISSAAKVLADNAQGTANTAESNAQTAITNAATADGKAVAAQGDATANIALLGDIAADNKVEQGEKETLLPTWNAILAEKTDIDSEADTFSVSKTAYGTAYDNLYGYVVTSLDTFGTMSATVTITRSTWNGYFEAYYNAKIEILNAISSAAKALADTAQGQANTATTDASNAQSTADARITTFIEAPTPTALAIGDIWYNSSDKNKMYRATATGVGNWVEVPPSIDNLNDTATTYKRVETGDFSGNHLLLSSTVQAAAYRTSTDTEKGVWNGKAVTFYQAGIPTALAAGDLWMDTDDGNRVYRATAAGDDEIGGGEWIEVAPSIDNVDDTGATYKKTLTSDFSGGHISMKSLEEVNSQGWINLIGNGKFKDVALTGWSVWLGTISQSTTQTKFATYSGKIIGGAGESFFTQNIDNHTDYRGMTLTIGAWVWAEDAASVQLRLDDGPGWGSSDNHTGDSSWEWLEATREINGANTRVEFQLRVGNAEVAYLSHAIMVVGEKAPGFASSELSDMFASGSWYDKSGVEVNADSGIDIYGTDMAFSTSKLVGTAIDSAATADAGASVIFTTNTNHGMSTGDQVVVRDMNIQNYDGKYTITDVPNLDEFKVTLTYTSSAYGSCYQVQCSVDSNGKMTAGAGSVALSSDGIVLNDLAKASGVGFSSFFFEGIQYAVKLWSPDQLVETKVGATSALSTITAGNVKWTTDNADGDYIEGVVILTYPLVATTWDKDRYWKVRPYLTNDSDQFAVICMGDSGHSSTSTNRRLGFYIEDDGIYAQWCNGAAHNESGELVTFSAGDTPLLEVRWDAGTSAKFYIDGTLEHTATANLPSGTTNAGDLFSCYLETDAIASKSLYVSEFKFMQVP